MGGSITDDSSQVPSLATQIDGADFIVTFVRLQESEQPANLAIVAECADELAGPWDAVPEIGSSEALNSDQTGLPSSKFERVDLRIDTNTVTCPFGRVTVSELP